MKKRIESICTEMQFAGIQADIGSYRGITLPLTTGDSALSLNMRAGEDGVLQSVDTPRTMGELEGDFAGCDVRNGARHLFMIRDGILYHEASLTDAGEWKRLSRRIAAMPDVPLQATTCASFFIFRMPDGKLFYLRAEGDGYEALGELPVFPEWSVEMTDTADYTSATEPLAFKSRPTDLRGGVPQEIADLVGNATVEKLKELQNLAHADGRFTAPVYVRLGIRLLDGSLLGISDKVRVPGPVWPGGDRIRFQLKRLASGEYTGTLSASATMQGYRIRVSVSANNLERWESVVKGYEIYVSEEHDIITGAAAGVSYSQADDALFARLQRKPTALLENVMLAAESRLRHEDTPSLRNTLLGFSHIHGAAADDSEPAATPPAAESIAGHGAFLHIAGERKLATMRYGNPYVTAGITDIGCRPTAIAAQPADNGAYTRQYIYVFTRDGILAITHDATGRHCSQRQISPEGVDSDEQIAVGTDSVWVISNNHNLLEIRGHQVKRRISGLTAMTRVGCDIRRGEVWVMPAQECQTGVMICHTGNPAQGYMRSFTPGKVLYGRSFLASLNPDPRSGNRLLVMVPDHPSHTSVKARGLWMSRKYRDYPEGLVNVEFRFGDTGNSLRLGVETTGTGNRAEGYVAAESPWLATRMPANLSRGLFRHYAGPVRFMAEGITTGLRSATISELSFSK